MTLLSLSLKNVYRAPRIYLSYYLNSTVAIFIFFIFSFLNFHPMLQQGLGGSSQLVNTFASLGLRASQVLVVLLSIIFLMFSFSSFISKRKSDISIYHMLGIKEKDLKRILLGENMLVGLAAILSALFMGLLFSKIIVLLFAQILLVPTLSFYLPTQALWITSTTFIFLYLLLSLILSLKIKIVQKKDLMSTAYPSYKLFSILAFVSLFVGYALVFAFISTINFIFILGAIFFTILGTYLLFNFALPTHLKRKKLKYFFLGEKLLELTDELNHIKQRGKLFTIISSSASIALVATSTMFVLGSNEFSSKNKEQAAYSFNPYYSETYDNHDKKLKEVTSVLQEWIFEEGYIPSIINITTTPVNYEETSDSGYGIQQQVLSLSSYNALSKAYGLPKLDINTNELVMINSDPATKKKLSQHSSKPELSTVYFKFGDTMKVGKLIQVDGDFSLTPFENNLFVASDSFLSQIRTQSKQDKLKYSVYTLLNFKEWDKNSKLNSKITNFINNSSMEDGEPISYSSKYEIKVEKQRSNSYVLFISLLLGVVFFMFSASVLSFHLFGDLDGDIIYYDTLYKVGTAPKTINRMIKKKIATVYFYPVIIALLNFTVAFIALQNIIGIKSWNYYWMIGAGYIILQFILFLYNARKYSVQVLNNIS